MPVWRAILALAFAGVPMLAAAQVIPPSEQPGRERFRFQEPRAPLAQPGGPAVSLPSTTAPAGAETITILIRDIRIEGATVYGDAALRPFYGDLIGKRVPLAAVYDLAKRITAKYGADGYILSRAIVPPQELSPGGARIRLQVIEGYVDRVEWPDRLRRYRDFFTDYAARITSERPVNVRTLERYLLLAGDLPGLKFSTSLKASAKETGASTLVVEVVEKPVDASGRFDNRGTQARGPNQYLSSFAFNNLAGGHEQLVLTAAGAIPAETLQYYAANYRQVLTSEGLSFFANGSYSFGKPGTTVLRDLDLRTTGTAVETGLAYPIIRSREANLTVTGLFFASDSRSDQIFLSPFQVDKLRGFRARADADIADSLGGINQLSGTLSQGVDGLGSNPNGDVLATRAAGQVDFTKIEGTVSRIQPLGLGFSAFGAAYAQWAFTPLLVPEQCGFGGRFFGRAFDPSQFLADQCVEALGELRYDIPHSITGLSQLQLYGFGDYGRLYSRTTALETPADTVAASVGAGLRLGVINAFNADLQVAKAMEGGARDDWRFFFAVTARY